MGSTTTEITIRLPRTWKRITLVLAVLATLGTAMALGLSSTTEKITLSGGTIAASDFVVDSLDTEVKGRNQVDVTITLRNTDTSVAHAADATLQLLDANGDVLLSEKASTGSIGPSGVWSRTYTFARGGLVEDYSTSFVVIEQSK